MIFKFQDNIHRKNVTKVIFEIYFFHYKTKYVDYIMSVSDGDRYNFDDKSNISRDVVL